MKLRSVCLFITVSLLATLTAMSSAAAQPPAPEGLSLTTEVDGVRVRWSLGAAGMAGLQSGEPPAPQLIALLLPAGSDPTPQVVASSQPWDGPLPAAPALPTHTLPDGSVFPPLPGFEPPPPPTAPLALLREGYMRGERIVVYALNPVYHSEGGAAALTSLSAHIPRATPLDTAGPGLAQTDTPLLAAVPGPDPLAARTAWTVRVDQGGIQALDVAALQAAGLSLAGSDPARLRLWRQGRALPLELRSASGSLTELRFYAPTPGDRYNSADIYWLTLEPAAVPTMATGNAQPSGALTCQPTALARGTWRERAFYDSRLPGPDGDRYFAADLRVGSLDPGPAEPDVIGASLDSSLPRTTGPMTLTISGASLFATTHTLSVTLAGPALTTSWAGTGNFTRILSFPASAGQAGLALMPVSQKNGSDGIHLDSITWQAPVQLNFNGQGAAFMGQAGKRCYQLSGLPAGATLYDVTDPAAPTRLAIGANSFEVDTTAAQDYLLAGPGTLHTPQIALHTPVDLAAPLNAQALYIAPAAFMPALAPLVAQRQAQGYSVAVVDVQAIYDTWSGAQVSPTAIRDFLRYARQTWPTRPVAVTLVGDGTSDPRNYLGIGQVSWLPPYLAQVDPGLGETACENCFVQLDGDDPLADPLPDLLLGRLPVKSIGELDLLAAKILAYENLAREGDWSGRAVYLADNADTAGDFAFVADQSIAGLPAEVKATRVYYDPAATGDEPWKVRDSLLAFQRTMDAFNSGAATVSFLGHGLAYQWAYTGPPLSSSAPQDRQYLLNVDFAGDLTNGPRLPIVLSMTCLTGQFQVPSVRGTTIDEALVLNSRGGAIATWSSSGLGVLYGHGALQRGFMRALWEAPAGSPPRLGDLALAGYRELFTTSGCCQETIRVYSLLGDPLTPARARAGISEVLLPIVQR